MVPVKPVRVMDHSQHHNEGTGLKMSSADILIFDVGSTCTKVTAFALEKNAGHCKFRMLGRGQDSTTVEDIEKGLIAARKSLENQNITISSDAIILSSCSAAGGLRMVAMGYMPRVTVKASKEVAMNSGARVLEVLSSAEPSEFRCEVLQEIRPDIILLTGGTDGGNTEAIVEHAEIVVQAVSEAGKYTRTSPWKPVVIIGGNMESQGPTTKILRDAGIDVWRVPNILPNIHELRVLPAREAIHEQFIKQITRAPGLAKLNSMVQDGKVVPTPGAVLMSAELLSNGTKDSDGAGSLMIVDLGGATTDVHSIIPELAQLAIEERGLIVSNEKQMSFRTVEGNLGMRVSACGIIDTLGPRNVLACADPDELNAALGLEKGASIPAEQLESLYNQLRNHAEMLEKSPQTIIPEGSGLLAAFDTALATAAVAVGIRRHAGRKADADPEMGIATGMPVGRDTRSIRTIIAVGGIFTHSSRERSMGILQRAFASPGMSLLPVNPQFIIDGQYQLYTLGMLSSVNAEAALDYGLNTFALQRQPNALHRLLPLQPKTCPQVCPSMNGSKEQKDSQG